MAIRTFKSKALQRLFEHGVDRKIPADQAKRIVELLDHLDAAATKLDLNMAGFHEMKGDRKGTFAWKVTSNWRLTFRFENGDAFDVMLEDYH
ncbi:MAG: type II toxin-antitoxin system RelE/ParE family toxin [Acidobacteriales bacterium]|nr:type II toxin-antitoxin system RelE/ParE family toxin [Terriglobales bacterium]